MELIFDLTRKSGANKTLAKGNEMISSNDRLHFHVKAELTAYLRDLATIMANREITEKRPVFTKKHPCHIFVHVHPPTNRRMDAPNWYPTVKALIDGLTDAGVFEDDNNQIVTSLTFIPEKKTDTGRYQIRLDIRPGTLRESR